MTQIHILTTPVPCQVLDLHPGSVILVTLPNNTSAREFQRLAEEMKQYFNAVLSDDWGAPARPDQQVQIIFAFDSITIQSLDEKMMAQAGWFRREPKSPS